MNIYPNEDGSYDVVNQYKVLFHVTEAKGATVVGVVNNKWKHQRRKLNTIPLSVLKFHDMIVTKIIEIKA